MAGSKAQFLPSGASYRQHCTCTTRGGATKSFQQFFFPWNFHSRIFFNKTIYDFRFCCLFYVTVNCGATSTAGTSRWWGHGEKKTRNRNFSSLSFFFFCVCKKNSFWVQTIHFYFRKSLAITALHVTCPHALGLGPRCTWGRSRWKIWRFRGFVDAKHSNCEIYN